MAEDCWEDASSTNSSANNKWLILQLPTVTPSSTRLCCLSNSCRPVLLNPGSGDHIRLPGTLCAALISFSIKVYYFVLQTSFCYKTKRVNWTVLKILATLFNKIVDLDLALFSAEVENHWCRLWKGAVTARWPLSESNTNGERSWFNSPDTDTNFWAGIQWLYDQ